MSDQVHNLKAADLVVGATSFALHHDHFHRLWLDGEGEAPPKRRRQRQPSLRSLIAQAEKAGKPVASVTTADGITLHFRTPEQQPTAPGNPWDEVLQ